MLSFKVLSSARIALRSGSVFGSPSCLSSRASWSSIPAIMLVHASLRASVATIVRSCFLSARRSRQLLRRCRVRSIAQVSDGPRTKNSAAGEITRAANSEAITLLQRVGPQVGGGSPLKAVKAVFSAAAALTKSPTQNSDSRVRYHAGISWSHLLNCARASIIKASDRTGTTVVTADQYSTFTIMAALCHKDLTEVSSHWSHGDRCTDENPRWVVRAPESHCLDYVSLRAVLPPDCGGYWPPDCGYCCCCCGAPYSWRKSVPHFGHVVTPLRTLCPQVGQSRVFFLVISQMIPRMISAATHRKMIRKTPIPVPASLAAWQVLRSRL